MLVVVDVISVKALSISTLALISTFAFSTVFEPTVNEPPSIVTVAASISTGLLKSFNVAFDWNKDADVLIIT